MLRGKREEIICELGDKDHAEHQEQNILIIHRQDPMCWEIQIKGLVDYGCTFDDVVVENVFTTDMAKFLEVAAYRNSVYTKQFPTGSWVEVKGLALPEFMIEIELEAHKAR